MRHKIKKYTYPFLFVFVLLSSFRPPTSENRTAISKLESYTANLCNTNNTAFIEGESLTISVFYAALGVYIKAGILTLNVDKTTLNGVPVYHAKAYGRTLSGYDWVFKVRDTYESYMTTSTLQPLKFSRNVWEGKYKKQENYSFSGGNIITTGNGRYRVPDCTLDVVSVVYQARNIDFSNISVGEKIPIRIFIDEEVHNLYVRYAGKETVKTKFGTFRSIKLKPLLTEGNTFKGGEKMTIWLSDDGNRVPLRIESALAVGSAKADLIGYKNLRYGSLSSRIK